MEIAHSSADTAPCEAIRPKLPLYRAGELDADAGAAVAAHLEICPACRAYTEQLQPFAAALDTALPTPTEALHARIMQGVRATPRRARRLPRYAAALAACFCLFAVVLALLQGNFFPSLAPKEEADCNTAFDAEDAPQDGAEWSDPTYGEPDGSAPGASGSPNDPPDSSASTGDLPLLESAESEGRPGADNPESTPPSSLVLPAKARLLFEKQGDRYWISQGESGTYILLLYDDGTLTLEHDTGNTARGAYQADGSFLLLANRSYRGTLRLQDDGTLLLSLD